MGTLTYADVAEGVRAALAAYTLALDDGRTDDIVATFCPDGSVDIPGMGAHQGHDALREAYGRVAPKRPQRHVVVNTLVTDWDDLEAFPLSDRSRAFADDPAERFAWSVERLLDGLLGRAVRP